MRRSLRASGVASTALVGALAAVCAYFAFALPVSGASTIATVRGPIAMLDLDFGLVGIAAPFLAIIAVLALVVALWSVQRGRPVDALLIALFTAAMVLVALARSVAVFFLAWEAMSLSSAFLVASHHERRFVRRTTFVYLLVAQGGALCILVALLLLATHAGSASFSEIGRHAAQLPARTRDAIFVLALVGFGSKAGLIPLHFWLPRAHPVAPAGASALLSGAMLNVALYGLLVVTLELAAPAPAAWGMTLVIAGALSALGGVLYAVVDRDMKRLLAYSSVENVGIIVLGFGIAAIARALGNDAVAMLALTAALFHACNHGVFKALLFLGSGVVADAEGTVDLERLGGLSRYLVWTSPAMLIGCAAAGGIPMLNGFVSEWLIFRSSIALLAGPQSTIGLVVLGAIAVLALTSGLAAACFVKLFGTGYLGAPRRQGVVRPREVPGFSTAAIVLLAVPCVAFGVVPMLAVGPLARIAAIAFGSAAAPGSIVAALPALPLALAALPVFGGLLALSVARRRGVRYSSTWTCGSAVTPAAQYTPTAFSKPIRTIFAFLLVPERSKRVETGTSTWFPSRIVYRTKSRYLIDELARSIAAVTLLFARRSRAVQSGSLRLYVAYALAALIVTVAVAR